jgi:hypothetical protein
VNIKHRNGGGYVKMRTYLGIRLLGETNYLRIKQILRIQLPDWGYGTENYFTFTLT